jgi:hypothetical protein
MQLSITVLGDSHRSVSSNLDLFPCEAPGYPLPGLCARWKSNSHVQMMKSAEKWL